MDKQEEPAAHVAEEPGGAAPSLNPAARESGTGKNEGEPDTVLLPSGPVADDPETGDGNPLGASHPDGVFTPAAVTKPHDVPKREGTPTRESMAETARPGTVGGSEGERASTLAAAALARELTGAGFASPGFASSGFTGSDTTRQAGATPPGDAPSAGSQLPAASPTSPGSPTSTGAGPAATTSTEWRTLMSPQARPVTPASSGAGAAPATRPAASPKPAAGPPPAASGQLPAPAKDGSTSSAGAPAPVSAAPGSWAPTPTYSPSGSWPGGAPGDRASEAASSATAAAAQMQGGPAGATQTTERFAAPQPGAGADTQVRSGDQGGSGVAVPFLRPRRKSKKLRPTAVGRPGGAIGNGRPPMTVKSRPGAAGAPTSQFAPRRVRPDGSGARDAQLVLARVEPWSVMKFSFLASLVGFVALMVAVAVLYFFFSALGVFTSIEHTVHLVTASNGNSGSNAASWFSAGTVLGYTMLAGAIDVVLITALATVGAVIYNAVTRVSGGIEITLQEAD